MVDITNAPRLWIIALWADYPKPVQWKSWADTAIAKAEVPEDWLIQLSLAQDSNAALDSLTRVCDLHFIWTDDELRDSGLGFYWLKYESSDTDLHFCLKSAGKFAERFDTSIEAEQFYSLLRRSEQGNDVEQAARQLFAPYRRLAENNWRKLMDC
jgi:hypothetical protein